MSRSDICKNPVDGGVKKIIKHCLNETADTVARAVALTVSREQNMEWISLRQYGALMKAYVKDTTLDAINDTAKKPEPAPQTFFDVAGALRHPGNAICQRSSVDECIFLHKETGKLRTKRVGADDQTSKPFSLTANEWSLFQTNWIIIRG